MVITSKVKGFLGKRMVITEEHVLRMGRILVPLMMADLAFLFGRRNYRSYLTLKDKLDFSEARVKELNADGGNWLRQGELAGWERMRCSYAANLKEYKWTAKFVEIFPPKG